MMNLELLFFASKATGDPYYKNIAIQHANTTLKNHFRPDFSSYHVVDYDSVTGKVKSKETEQGFSDNSTWARGQAWAIYGFTMMYRETKDPKYLTAVQKMGDYFINNPNLPKDKIPYWDFNVNQPGYTPLWNYDPNKYAVVPRDASAAAIAASALIELSGYVDKNTGKKYLQTAELILKSLSSPKYRAAVGANGGFILMHSCGGVPGDAEVDVPLIYADYYYIEALTRLDAIVKK
jgi:chondroitin AC lyase